MYGPVRLGTATVRSGTVREVSSDQGGFPNKHPPSCNLDHNLGGCLFPPADRASTVEQADWSSRDDLLHTEGCRAPAAREEIFDLISGDILLVYPPPLDICEVKI